MGWRMDSSAGAALWDTEPLTNSDLACRDEELSWLMRQERRNWKLINGRIAASGDPTASRGNYAANGAYALDQQNTGIALTGTTTAALWTPASYTPIPANSVQAPESFRVYASGIVTTSTTSLTTTILPSISGTTTAGSTLGSSGALSFPGATAITAAFWRLYYNATIRTAGEAGTAVGDGWLIWTTAAGTGTGVAQSLFGAGNTVVTGINFVTTAQGICISGTPSASTITVTPNQIHFQNWD